ncbi:hypothetical protein ACFFNY_23465 [Paenibacillus hodogayensis]|uniref:Uncharacterized protein n=1 Tax=Paenibacillus hodogayensis TaxID=279208 RepID=A0ABV5W2J0_9BACL
MEVRWDVFLIIIGIIVDDGIHIVTLWRDDLPTKGNFTKSDELRLEAGSSFLARYFHIFFF